MNSLNNITPPQSATLILQSETISYPTQDVCYVNEDEKFYYTFSNDNQENPNQIEILLNKYNWLKLEGEQNNLTLSCLYCNSYLNLNDNYDIYTFLNVHQQSCENKYSSFKYMPQDNYVTTMQPMKTNAFKNEDIDQFSAINETSSSSSSYASNKNEYGSILKAINKRKLHITCPKCESKVVNMSDHLVKKHNIKDRNERKYLMDTVRRTYLLNEQQDNCQSSYVEQQQQRSKSTTIKKSIKTERKLIKCPICKDTNKYFVNISDHLIKIHHLNTSEKRKPILKSIKTNKNFYYHTDNDLSINQIQYNSIKKNHFKNLSKTILKRYKKFYKKQKKLLHNKCVNTDECYLVNNTTANAEITSILTATSTTTNEFTYDDLQNFDESNFSNSCILINNLNQSSSSSSSSSSTIYSANLSTINSSNEQQVMQQQFSDNNDLLLNSNCILNTHTMIELKNNDLWNRIEWIEKTIQKTTCDLSFLRQNLDICTNAVNLIISNLSSIKVQLNTNNDTITKYPSIQSSSLLSDKIQSLTTNLNEINNFIGSQHHMSSILSPANDYIQQFTSATIIKEELD